MFGLLEAIFGPRPGTVTVRTVFGLDQTYSRNGLGSVGSLDKLKRCGPHSCDKGFYVLRARQKESVPGPTSKRWVLRTRHDVL